MFFTFMISASTPQITFNTANNRLQGWQYSAQNGLEDIIRAYYTDDFGGKLVSDPSEIEKEQEFFEKLLRISISLEGGVATSFFNGFIFFGRNAPSFLEQLGNKVLPTGELIKSVGSWDTYFNCAREQLSGERGAQSAPATTMSYTTPHTEYSTPSS